MKAKYLIAIGIAFLLLFLIATIPASLFYASINKIPNLKVEGISGKLWNGSAANVSYRGLDMGKLQWDASLWSLFTLSLNTDVALKGADNDLSANLTLNSETIEAENLKAIFPANWIPTLSQAPVKTQGLMLLRFKEARLSKGSSPYIYGAISWQNAEIKTPFGANSILGNITMGISTENGVLIGDAKSDRDPMDLQASLRFTYPNKVQATGTVKNELPPALDGFFKLFAKPDGKGRLNFEYNGPVPGL